MDCYSKHFAGWMPFQNPTNSVKMLKAMYIHIVLLCDNENDRQLLTKILLL